MILATIAAALMAQASPAVTPPSAEIDTQDQTVKLSLEARAKLRCSAAFALVAHGQSQGSAAAQKWPDLSERGREFFVRSLAALMDQTGLDRDGIGELVSVQAQQLRDAGEVDEVMPACLVMLDNSGL